MGKEQCRTRHFHNMFEVSSLVQKAIRRQDAKMAYYAANELIPRYRNYLWKRLLTVSAEDCFDMVTGEIVKLHRIDVSRQDDKTIAKAVSILLNARKNRDADYFACNLLNSRDEADLSGYIEDPIKDDTCATKNGHCMFDLAIVFKTAVDRQDDIMAGYAANELRVYYRKFTWKMIIMKAREIGCSDLESEIRFLKEADESTKETSIIFLSKAIVLLLKVSRSHTTDMFQKDFRYNDTIDLGAYTGITLTLPQYIYDCHTIKGKIAKKTKRDFVIAEQAALRPLEEGDYDHSSWEHFFWLSANGFFRNEYTPHPSEERVKELQTGAVQLDLFGE